MLNGINSVFGTFSLPVLYHFVQHIALLVEDSTIVYKITSSTCTSCGME